MQFYTNKQQKANSWDQT